MAEQVMEPTQREIELKRACQLIEFECRSFGKDCVVVFMRDGVSIAPPKWPADSTGNSLYEAILQARKHED